MTKQRLEAFSDGVIAILITIMVLELKVPHGADWAALHEIRDKALAYILSFVFVAIYWNNHHHMFQMVTAVNGRILWANAHLLFWLSVVPVTTAWMGEHATEPVPVVAYGIVLVMCAIAYTILQATIVAHQGSESRLGAAVGGDIKGKLSLASYLIAIPLAFISTAISIVIYALVAGVWLIPDRRIESRINEREM
jgi:uncharacterized membrane protein